MKVILRRSLTRVAESSWNQWPNVRGLGARMTVEFAVKELEIGADMLFKFLREHGLLMPINEPFPQHIDARYFRVVKRNIVIG